MAIVGIAELMPKVIRHLQSRREYQIRLPDGRVNYPDIRRLYADNMNDIMSRDGWVDPYLADWPSIFTPIERQMWFMIREAIPALSGLDSFDWPEDPEAYA